MKTQKFLKIQKTFTFNISIIFNLIIQINSFVISLSVYRGDNVFNLSWFTEVFKWYSINFSMMKNDRSL